MSERERVIYNGIDFTAIVDAAIAARRSNPRKRRYLSDIEVARVRELARREVAREDLARLTGRSEQRIRRILAVAS